MRRTVSGDILHVVSAVPCASQCAFSWAKTVTKGCNAFLIGILVRKMTCTNFFVTKYGDMAHYWNVSHVSFDGGEERRTGQHGLHHCTSMIMTFPSYPTTNRLDIICTKGSRTQTLEKADVKGAAGRNKMKIIEVIAGVLMFPSCSGWYIAFGMKIASLLASWHWRRFFSLFFWWIAEPFKGKKCGTKK